MRLFTYILKHILLVAIDNINNKILLISIKETY